MAGGNGDMLFEYDEWKNEYTIGHHDISVRQAARVFFDYSRNAMKETAAHRPARRTFMMRRCVRFRAHEGCRKEHYL